MSDTNPKLTSVQKGVLRRLLEEPQGRATVGRGLPFKCNRTTARSLEELGLVILEGHRFASVESLTMWLTPKGLDTAKGL